MRIRPIAPWDQSQLVLEHPDVRICAEGWGRKGDIGVVGEDEPG